MGTVGLLFFLLFLFLGLFLLLVLGLFFLSFRVAHVVVPCINVENQHYAQEIS